MWTWLVQSLGAGLLLARASYAAVLVDFQVAQPPPLLVPSSAQQCTIQILERTFGNSYGDPEIVQYTPPTDCGAVGSWAGISLNFTVTSNGTQYDRLGIFTFQNVEIWRTSTPEPTTDGIIWTYLKDATRYLPLFSEPGTFILELDNILATGLNGQYATTLTATFYASSDEYPSAPRANTIIPLNVTVPQNAVAIYAELYASGNGNEEFWYYNVANDYLGDLPSGLTYGNGPFVSGVAFPYAVIFTGGIHPQPGGQPITSYGALDLPTYFIDLTPFVPVLTDGQPHNISIDVVSAETNHTINDNWYVSGNLQVVTDSSSGPTTGNITVYNVEPYAETSTTGTVGDNGDLTVTVTAKHSIQIQSEFTSGSGQHTSVIWTQDLEYSNTQYYMDNLLVNNVAQTATGSFLSTHNGVPALSDDFSYPLYINMTYLDDNYDSWTADFDHSYNRVSSPSPFILGSTINERQVATSYFVVSSNGNYGNGTNNNTFNYVDSDGDTYWRNVGAADNNVTYDSIGGSLSGSSPFMLPLSAPLSQGVMAKPRLPGGK
ncbi:peptide N-acetyl-beta-D-glucosaminyl asparaginase amidase A-domain-containing protein [Fomitopsis serialis]|uniref:peptide N-acetyl-beta-D-glucosaminyl asparaginase amidase A-domain-containing protein n=1 Tax=Fomitopsis serialis TaxID=139415 RepID=UPI002008AFB7|nr:peptide N-acetyl-beta-D-glucosaminyl asparaginase amidase A-domain-containing protein [Neoantrodia serialis]KAH9911065.1 peptide N-acetyl-beta-D-glucosaminyl asparaginase amidase A-domain-containing protein [Neoantrodia serialis]